MRKEKVEKVGGHQWVVLVKQVIHIPNLPIQIILIFIQTILQMHQVHIQMHQVHIQIKLLLVVLVQEKVQVQVQELAQDMAKDQQQVHFGNGEIQKSSKDQKKSTTWQNLNILRKKKWK